MAKKLDLDAELDRLYGDPPDDFVGGRNELVKALRAEGRKDDAAAVKGLKKPTRPAALVNWLSRERRKDVSALAKVAERMRDPKLSDGKQLRAAVADERKAIEKLMSAASGELDDRGGPAATLERVAETLRAMASDPDVEAAVMARRLEREQEASTIGFAREGGVSSPPSEAKKERKAKAEKAKPKGPDLRRLRTEADRAARAAAEAEEAVEEGEGRVADAERELEQAREELKQAKAAARSARSEAKKAARRLDSAERS